MKKTKVVLVTFSPQLADGSRETRFVEEICSCKSRYDAEYIMRLLRNNEPYKSMCNEGTVKSDEWLRVVTTM